MNSASFILFNEQWPALSILNDEQRGKLMQAFFHENGAFASMPELDQATQGIFLLIQQRIRANREKYENRCLTNKANGSKGGRPRNQEKPDVFFQNPPDADPETDSDPEERHTGVCLPGKVPGARKPHDEDKPEEKSPDSCPNCPHQQIVALYHEILPMLPKVKTWQGSRPKNLGARWRETWDRLRRMGKPHDIAALLSWWEAYFRQARASPFLLGQKLAGGRPFFADLGWLILPENYAKVLEGKYLERRAA